MFHFKMADLFCSESFTMSMISCTRWWMMNGRLFVASRCSWRTLDCRTVATCSPYHAALLRSTTSVRRIADSDCHVVTRVRTSAGMTTLNSAATQWSKSAPLDTSPWWSKWPRITAVHYTQWKLPINKRLTPGFHPNAIACVACVACVA